MMRWLPRISFQGTCIAAREYEAEGSLIQLCWGPFVIELTFARIDRTYGPEID